MPACAPAGWIAVTVSSAVVRRAAHSVCMRIIRYGDTTRIKQCWLIVISGICTAADSVAVGAVNIGIRLRVGVRSSGCSRGGERVIVLQIGGCRTTIIAGVVARPASNDKSIS